MIRIITAKKENLKIVRSIAERTWPETFGKILSSAQIDYMLNLLYDLKKLEEQCNQGHSFLLADEAGEKLGFVGSEPNHERGKTKIHKIYVLPAAQGKGIGKLLINAVKEIALKNDQASLLLNVNKYNRGAIDFYEYLGFTIIKSEVIAIGNGYVMDDYVMELVL